MSFTKAQIIKTELMKDGANKIQRIYLVVQIQDDAISGVKQFDYVIDGGTLEEIRGNLKAGALTLVREQVRAKHAEWVVEVSNAPTTSDLTPAQIKNQFGNDEITKLD